MFQLSFDVNTNISSTLLFPSQEISCIFHYVSYPLLHSYIKGSEDKEPDLENIILLKIYPLILTTFSAERDRVSIHYFNVLCKRDLFTSSKFFSASEIRQDLFFFFFFSTQEHLGTFKTGTGRKNQVETSEHLMTLWKEPKTLVLLGCKKGHEHIFWGWTERHHSEPLPRLAWAHCLFTGIGCAYPTSV